MRGRHMEQNDEHIILDKKKAKPYTRAKDATFDADAFKKWLSEGIWQMVKKGEEDNGTDQKE